MSTVYRKAEYNVYKERKGTYVIHNTKKKFSEGHTHTNGLKTSKYLIDLCIYKSIPNTKCKRFFISLTRITDDDKYKKKLIDVLENRCKKKLAYVNKGKRGYC